MTVAEVQRAMEGAVWRMKAQAQFDYSLANTIGFSVGRVVDNKITLPAIEDIYPDLFQEEIKKREEEEKLAQQEAIATQNSVNRFMEFALKHNAKKRKGVE